MAGGAPPSSSATEAGGDAGSAWIEGEATEAIEAIEDIEAIATAVAANPRRIQRVITEASRLRGRSP